jgi:multiple sugar transport system ATP-binding protein
MPTQERNITMVFQDCTLYPHLTVAKNMAFPLVSSGGADQSAIDARVREMAYGLGLDHQLARRPGMLSAGSGSGSRWAARLSAASRRSC